MKRSHDHLTAPQFFKDIAVGQLFMVYLSHQQTYWPAKVINVSKLPSENPHSQNVTVQLYSYRRSSSHRSQKLSFNLKNMPIEEFIPFESVYQEDLKNWKNIGNIQHFTSSPSFHKAMTNAAKDYEARLKTSKMYKELKRQSQNIQVLSRTSKRLENKKVQIHYHNSSVKFSQKFQNKTEVLKNPAKSRSKKKNCQNNVPISLQLNSQDSLNISKKQSQFDNFSSVSSKISNKNCKEQKKCSRNKNVAIQKKRDYNTMKASGSPKFENECILLLQKPTKKRKGSKVSMSVIDQHPKKQVSNRTLNYCESQKISNRSKTSESRRMANHNNKVKGNKNIIMERLNNTLVQRKNTKYSSSSESIISYSSQANSIPCKLKQSKKKAVSKPMKKEIQNRNTKKLQEKQLLEISSSLSSKAFSQSQKNSSKQFNQKSQNKSKSSKKQPKQITPKVKLEQTKSIKKEPKIKKSTQKALSKSSVLKLLPKNQEMSIEKSDEKAQILNFSTKVKQEIQSRPKNQNKSVNQNMRKQKSTSKQNKQIGKKESPKTKKNKEEKVRIKKSEQDSQENLEAQKSSKWQKYSLLLSRLLFDHSKNKFPILQQKYSSNVIYLRRAKIQFNSQSKVKIKSFGELINFVKHLQQEQASSKSSETGIILYEEDLQDTNQRDPYVLTYSQLSQRDCIHKIVLQNEEGKPSPTGQFANIIRSQQWSMQGFLLQSICSLIGSWNIINSENKRFAFLNINSVNYSVSQRMQTSSSVSKKKGKSKGVQKNNIFSKQHQRCHEYCYSLGLQEKNLLTNLCQLIKMYITYQDSSSQNYGSQQENSQQNFSKNHEIGESLLQRLKKRYRHFLTYHKVIEKQVEEILKVVSPLCNLPQTIIKKEQKLQQCSLSAQEQTGTVQQHNIFSSGYKKKPNQKNSSGSKQPKITNNKLQQRTNIVCWLIFLKKQLQELLIILQRTRSNLTNEISRLQKQQCKMTYYFGMILGKKSTRFINNTDKPISPVSGQCNRQVLSSEQKQKMVHESFNHNNIFAQSLQLPKQTCFNYSPQPYENYISQKISQAQVNKSCLQHLIQTENDFKEKEFQQFLKRVLNVKSLEEVYSDNAYEDIKALNTSYHPQSNQNQIESNQFLMRSELSFSEMQTLKSDILSAFDELENEFLQRQKNEMSY